MALRKTPKAHWELAVAQTKRAGVHGEQPAVLRKLPIAHRELAVALRKRAVAYGEPAMMY